MTSTDYKQILLNAYKNIELSDEDFESTLDHYTSLVIAENTLKTSEQLN